MTSYNHMSHIVTVDLSKVSLSSGQLDCLATEYYGLVKESSVAIGSEELPSTIDIEFMDHAHPILTSPIKALFCSEAFKSALDGFRTDGGTGLRPPPTPLDDDDEKTDDDTDSPSDSSTL